MADRFREVRKDRIPNGITIQKTCPNLYIGFYYFQLFQPKVFMFCNHWTYFLHIASNNYFKLFLFLLQGAAKVRKIKNALHIFGASANRPNVTPQEEPGPSTEPRPPRTFKNVNMKKSFYIQISLYYFLQVVNFLAKVFGRCRPKTLLSNTLEKPI